jgi:hypothetical protein
MRTRDNYFIAWAFSPCWWRMMGAGRLLAVGGRLHGLKARATGAAIGVGLLLAFVGTSAAAAEEPRVTRMTVSPAAVPEPALKYRLMPDPFDQEPGNAVPFYLYAISWAFREERVDWLDLPLEEMPREGLGHEYRFDLLDAGARRTVAHWEVILREHGFGVLLPHLNDIRHLAAMNALRMRLHVVNERYEDALRAAQTGFAMSRHHSQEAVLVQALVAAGMVELMVERVQEMITRPDAPNLYWALADMPQPFIDARDVTRWERSFFYFHFPELRDAGPGTMTAEQWRVVWDRLRELLNGQVDREQPNLTAVAQEVEAEARRHLIERGIEQQVVERMSAEEAAGLYFLQTFEDISDDSYKWSAKPYWQADAGRDRVPVRFTQLKRQQPANPFLDMIASTDRAHFTFTRLDRRIALLQIVEGIRAYAAAHGGVPASLEAMVETPAPIDPVTGRAFEYRVEDGVAIIETAALEGVAGAAERYEVRLRE